MHLEKITCNILLTKQTHMLLKQYQLTVHQPRRTRVNSTSSGQTAVATIPVQTLIHSYINAGLMMTILEAFMNEVISVYCFTVKVTTTLSYY